jgi:hypothetical protein
MDRVLSDFLSGKRGPAPRPIAQKCAEAESADLSEDGMARLAADPDPRVRIRIAARGDLPERVVLMLCGDACWHVRQQLQAVPD